MILAPTNDTFWEGDETIVVDGSATAASRSRARPSRLSDNETRPSIILYFDPSLNVFERQIQEDSGTPASFPLHAELVGGSTLETDTAITLSVDADSTAVLDMDFTGTLPAMEIEAGTTTDTVTVAVTPIDNSDRDGGTFIVIGGTADDHQGIPFAVRSTPETIRIKDDEPPLSIAVSVTPTSLREADLVADTPVSFDITLTLRGDDPLPSAVTVELTKSWDPCGLFDVAGSNIAEIVFPQGSTSTSLTRQQTVSLTSRGTAIDRLCVVRFQAAASGYGLASKGIWVIPDENPSIRAVTIRGSTGIAPNLILTDGERLEVFLDFNRPFRILGGSASATMRIGDTSRTSTCTTSTSGLQCNFYVELGEHDLDGFQPGDLGALTITGSTVDWYDTTIPVTVDTTLPAESNISIDPMIVHGAVSSYRLIASIESLQESPDPTNITVTATWLAGRTFAQDITFQFLSPTSRPPEPTTRSAARRPSPFPGEKSPAARRWRSRRWEDGIREARSESVLIGGGNTNYS